MGVKKEPCIVRQAIKGREEYRIVRRTKISAHGGGYDYEHWDTGYCVGKSYDITLKRANAYFEAEALGRGFIEKTVAI